MTLDMKDPGQADEALDKLQYGTVSVPGSKPGHELCSNAVHVKITRENCHTVSCDKLTIAAMSLMVLRWSSCTSHRIVSTFLGAERVLDCPDLLSSLSDVLLLLKHVCHSKHLARLMAAFPYACCIISNVSAADLLSFTHNLMFALCSSFTSMLKSQMWRNMWWQTLVLCNSQCSHSDATRHTEWRRSLLPSTSHAFMYCHRLAFCGTSLETFWYTYVLSFPDVYNWSLTVMGSWFFVLQNFKASRYYKFKSRITKAHSNPRYSSGW
jgi:hypothetical protein